MKTEGATLVVTNIVVLALSMMACVSCQTFQNHPAQTNSRRVNIVATPRSYQIINLGSQFEQFWKVAQDRPFEDQLRLWNEIVEKPYQSFYDSIVWQKKDNPKWEERKIRRLKEMFGKYPALHFKMIEAFHAFDETLDRQIAKFANFFPDSKFALPIYAAPTTTFNGKGGEGGEADEALGKTVLAFGIDMAIEFKNDPDVLYSHELFHIYHTDTIGVNERVFLEQGHMSLPLWLEGLATYVSQQMNPNASLQSILMDKDLPEVKGSETKRLAAEFLSEVNEKAFDAKNPGIYKKWFAIDRQYKVGGGLPQRCGYLLGLRVAQELAKSHTLFEMVHWNVPNIHAHIIEALTTLSKKAVAEVRNGSNSATVPDQTIPVNDGDVRILRRASQILNDASKWNRHDNRECSNEAKTFSLYCALFTASVEINGEFDHRLGALEETRRTIEAASKGKVFEHRLMDYNNAPSTTFKNIKDVLRKTEQRIANRLRTKSH